MSKVLKFLGAFAFCFPLFVASAQAGYVTTVGNEATANLGRTFWEGQIQPGFLDDDLTGLSCGGGICTSAAGNTFTEGSAGTLSAQTGSQGVLDGIHLDLTKAADANVVGRFTWNLAGAGADAFGFFSHDNDAGMVQVAFVDGSLQTIPILSSGSEDDMFFGIWGLGLIDSVTISTTDPGGISHWDNFVSGTTVPLPPAVPLFLSALALFGIVARRRKVGRMSSAHA